MASVPLSAEKARRLIALLGQLEPDARVRIADLAAEVGATEAELASDLETLSMCGIAPYGPGDLVPLMIDDDGWVEVFGRIPALRGPVRLSPAEARALASALQAAGFTAEDSLTAKLIAAAAPRAFDAEELEHTIRTATAAHLASVYETLAKAAEDAEVVRIEYAKAGGTQATSREVEVVSLFAERGAWYLTGWCRNAGDWRTFRVDRIRSAQATGATFDRATRSGSPTAIAAFAAEGLPTATVRFAPGEEFSDREWPGATVTETGDDGSVTVAVPFGGTAWIARRVVARLGRVEVLAPDEVRQAVVRLAGGRHKG